MVRRHYHWTRARQTRSRPKTPAPTNGWLLKELVELTGLPDTTLRFYVAQRLIRPIERRGTLTRYDRRQLLRVLGLTRLERETKASLAERGHRLDAMGNAELEAWLRAGPLPQAAADALEKAPQGNPTQPHAALAAHATLAANTALAASATAPARGVLPVNADGAEAAPAAPTNAVLGIAASHASVEHWQRITLLPGLDLMLRADAKTPALLTAQRIIDEYGVK